MEDLVKRGLTGVRYVVCDEHQGLVQSVRRYFRLAIRMKGHHHARPHAAPPAARRDRDLFASVMAGLDVAPERVLSDGRTAPAGAVRRPASGADPRECGRCP